MAAGAATMIVAIGVGVVVVVLRDVTERLMLVIGAGSGHRHWRCPTLCAVVLAVGLLIVVRRCLHV